jgi:nitrogen-specific signal transduction histidine kinase
MHVAEPSEGIMILLVTSSNRRVECGNALEQTIGESVEVCETVRKAASLLRNNEYSSVILDDPMVEVEAESLESLLNNIGLAVPVYVNLAVSNAERVARELRLALRRHRESRIIAVRAAESQLRSEIRDAVTGILLSAQLAMRSPDMPTDALEKLTSVCQLASNIRTRLESVN